MTPETRKALTEGLTDAIGFVVGALAGGLLARLLGFDFLSQAGWDARAMIGIALVGLGAGMGRGAARHLLRKRTEPR